MRVWWFASGVIGLLGVVLATGGCIVSPASPAEWKEVSRTTAPDGKVDAVLCTADAGATTAEAYHLFLVKAGTKAKKDARTADFTADHVDKLAFEWKSPKRLLIKYRQARIFQFSNFWQSPDVDDFRHVVELQLTPLHSGSVLSPEDRWER